MEDQKEKKPNQPVIPPRLQVLLSETGRAIVLCRKKAQQVGTFGWDRKTDKITLGQWLKGRIYFERCDISPDGNHLIYFAMGKGSWKTWTAVSKAPYLKALDIYIGTDTWGGGGLFTSNQSYWFSEPICYEFTRKDSNLKVINSYPYGDSHSHDIRLERNGWIKIKAEHLSENQLNLGDFFKKVNDSWILYKSFYHGNIIPQGKTSSYEKYRLINTQNGNECDCSDWEWADLDGKRIVWTAQGKLFAAKLNNQGLTQLKVLHDFNNEEFVAVAAPY